MRQTTTKAKRHEEYRYIGQGIAGVYAEGVSLTDSGITFSVSGCRERSIEEFVANSDRPIAEGAWLIDKQRAIEQHGPKSVFRSPLPDIRGDRTAPAPDITPGASIVADALAEAPGNGFGALVLGARAGAICLDTVGMVAYADYWRGLGARIGRVFNGRIVWEDANGK